MAKHYKYRDDNQLIIDLLKNDSLAIFYVFYNHFNSLLKYNVIKATKGKVLDYSDLVQDLYLYISNNNWEKLRRYDSSMPFVNWFSVVSYRFFKDSVRSMIDSLDKMPISHIENNNISFSSNEIDTFTMDVKNILKDFEPPRDKSILEAFLLKDEEPSVIATRFGVTIDNLYNIKRRALARLRKKLV